MNGAGGSERVCVCVHVLCVDFFQVSIAGEVWCVGFVRW